MKVKNSIKIALMSTVATAFIGCGGGSGGGSGGDTAGSSTAVSTGAFLDAPVKGLTYKTTTQSGFTDVNGHFKYEAGEMVEFKLGNLVLGKANGAVLLTPYSISDNNDTVTNIALLLQNFDGNRSDKRVLDLSKLEDYNFTASDFNLSTTSATLKGQIDTLFADNNFASYRDDTNNTVLDATAVKTTLDSYLAQNSIKYDKKFTEAYLQLIGTTFVLYRDWNETTNSAMNWIVDSHKWNNGKVYSSKYSFTSNPPLSNVTYTIENGKIKNNGFNDSWYDTVLTVTDDYLEGCTLEPNGTCQEQSIWYAYFDQTKAKKALEIKQLQYSKQFTEAYLNGKTLWMTDDIDGIFSLTFHTNGQIDMYSVKTKTTEQVTYTISADGKLAIVFDPEDGTDTHTITNVDDSGIQTSVSASDGNFNRTFFYTEATAAASIDIINNKKFTEAYLNGKTLYAVYSDAPNSYITHDFNSSNIGTFTDMNPSSPTYQQTLQGYFTGEGMNVIQNGKLYEFTYNTVNGQRVYNDGVNIFTVTAVDSTKISTSMQIPGGSTLGVDFYFNKLF